MTTKVLNGRSAGVEGRLWERSLAVLTLTAVALLFGTVEMLGGLGIEPGGLIIKAERYMAPLADAFEGRALFLLGCLTLYLAWHLWMRKRAALLLFAGLFMLQAAMLGVAYRMFLPAGACMGVSLTLIWLCGEFPVMPDQRSLSGLKKAAPFLAVTYYCVAFGAVAVGLRGSETALLSREVLVQPLLIAAGEIGGTGAAAVPGERIRLLLFFGFAMISAWAVTRLLRPHRWEPSCGPEERARARGLMRRWGYDTISYFALRSDKDLFFLDDRAFLSYRCMNGIAVVTGDPVGPPGLYPELLGHFRDFCMERGWRVACLGASERGRRDYEGADMRGICYGEEAVIHLPSFTLEGRKNKGLRHAVKKWEKAGARMEFMFNAGIPDHLRLELSQISADWRGRNPETGFSMGLGRLLRAEDQDCLLALAYDAEDNPVGFAYLAPVYPDLGFSLDITRTSRSAGNGINEFIFAKTALFLKERAYRYLSLHFAAFSHHYREGREEGGNGLVRALCRAADRILPVMSLYRFDRKFNPEWKKRYLMVESWLDLPRAGLVAVAAESFLRLNRITRQSQS